MDASVNDLAAQSGHSSWGRAVRAFVAEESGQTVVEYMLGISVVVIGMSVVFLYMGNSTRDIFNNARRMIELPYP